MSADSDHYSDADDGGSIYSRSSTSSSAHSDDASSEDSSAEPSPTAYRITVRSHVRSPRARAEHISLTHDPAFRRRDAQRDLREYEKQLEELRRTMLDSPPPPQDRGAHITEPRRKQDARRHDSCRERKEKLPRAATRPRSPSPDSRANTRHSARGGQVHPAPALSESDASSSSFSASVDGSALLERMRAMEASRAWRIQKMQAIREAVERAAEDEARREEEEAELQYSSSSVDEVEEEYNRLPAYLRTPPSPPPPQQQRRRTESSYEQRREQRARRLTPEPPIRDDIAPVPAVPAARCAGHWDHVSASDIEEARASHPRPLSPLQTRSSATSVAAERPAAMVQLTAADLQRIKLILREAERAAEISDARMQPMPPAVATAAAAAVSSPGVQRAADVTVEDAADVSPLSNTIASPRTSPRPRSPPAAILSPHPPMLLSPSATAARPSPGSALHVASSRSPRPSSPLFFRDLPAFLQHVSLCSPAATQTEEADLPPHVPRTPSPPRPTSPPATVQHQNQRRWRTPPPSAPPAHRSASVSEVVHTAYCSTSSLAFTPPSPDKEQASTKPRVTRRIELSLQQLEHDDQAEDRDNSKQERGDGDEEDHKRSAPAEAHLAASAHPTVSASPAEQSEAALEHESSGAQSFHNVSNRAEVSSAQDHLQQQDSPPHRDCHHQSVAVEEEKENDRKAAAHAAEEKEEDDSWSLESESPREPFSGSPTPQRPSRPGPERDRAPRASPRSSSFALKLSYSPAAFAASHASSSFRSDNSSASWRPPVHSPSSLAFGHDDSVTSMSSSSRMRAADPELSMASASLSLRSGTPRAPQGSSRPVRVQSHHQRREAQAEQRLRHFQLLLPSETRRRRRDE